MKTKILKIMLLAMVLTMGMVFVTGCGTKEDSKETDTPVADQTQESPDAEGSKEVDATDGESALLTKIKEKGVLLVASSNDAPFAYIDVETGEFSGIDAVIIKEVAKRLGIEKVEMKEVAFENLLIELNTGSVDMVTDAMYIKDERKEIALFTNVWYQEGEGIIIPKDSSITSKEDLVNASLGGQKGTAFLETAQAWEAEGKVKSVGIYAKQTDLVMAVNTGKIDACITDGIVAAYTLAQNADLNLKILSPYVSEAAGKIGAAIRFEDKDFLLEVNAVLDEMKEDGTLMQILTDFGLNDDYYVNAADGQTENIK